MLYRIALDRYRVTCDAICTFPSQSLSLSLSLSISFSRFPSPFSLVLRLLRDSCRRAFLARIDARLKHIISVDCNYISNELVKI